MHTFWAMQSRNRVPWLSHTYWPSPRCQTTGSS